MKIGLETFAANPAIADKWGRCGLVSNQSSITSDFQPAWKVVAKHIGQRLSVLFGPQHGFESTVQHNMIETPHLVHAPTGLKVYSLYSETREPTAEMLEGLDTIIFDLPVTGCRIYTYKYTLAACLRAAKKHNKRVVVFDRPNPLGGKIIEGPVLDLAVRSFVGEFAIPTRHGLTMAEAGLLFNKEIGADLEVVALQGWDPKKMWHELDRPYVLTSPNLPNVDSVYVFPGMVAFEGTNVSEGRGTGLPFQFVGAPYIDDSHQLLEVVNRLLPETPGLHLRPAEFQPVAQKGKDVVCRGLQLHVTDARQVRSYLAGLAIMRAFFELGGSKFSLLDPPL